MKGILLIVLLAVTYGYSAMDGEHLPAAFKRPERGVRQVILESRNTNTTARLLASINHQIGRSHRTAHKQEILIRMVDYARITSVTGWPHTADAELVVLEGGWLQNYIKLGYTTKENEDFGYSFEVYGILECDD